MINMYLVHEHGAAVADLHVEACERNTLFVWTGATSGASPPPKGAIAPSADFPPPQHWTQTSSQQCAAQSEPAAWPPRRRAMSVDAPSRRCSTRAARRPRTGLARFRRALGSGCIVQLCLWQRRRLLLGPWRAQLAASGSDRQRPHGPPRQVRPPRRRRHRAGAVTAVARGARGAGRSISRRCCEVCFRAGGAAGAARLQAVGGVLRGALLVAVEPPVREPASTGRMLLKTASDGSGYWPSPARRPSGGGGAAGAGTCIHRTRLIKRSQEGQAVGRVTHATLLPAAVREPASVKSVRGMCQGDMQ